MDFMPFEGTRWAVIAVDTNDNFNFDGKDRNYLTTRTSDGPMPTTNEASMLLGRETVSLRRTVGTGEDQGNREENQALTPAVAAVAAVAASEYQ